MSLDCMGMQYFIRQSELNSNFEGAVKRTFSEIINIFAFFPFGGGVARSCYLIVLFTGRATWPVRNVSK